MQRLSDQQSEETYYVPVSLVGPDVEVWLFVFHQTLWSKNRLVFWSVDIVRKLIFECQSQLDKYWRSWMATDPTYDPKATVFDELGTEALRGKGDICFFFHSGAPFSEFYILFHVWNRVKTLKSRKKKKETLEFRNWSTRKKQNVSIAPQGFRSLEWSTKISFLTRSTFKGAICTIFSCSGLKWSTECKETIILTLLGWCITLRRYQWKLTC